MQKIYLSGKISGLTREEYLANFDRAEEALHEEGFVRVVNPAHFALARWPWLFRIVGYRLTLLYDLWRLMRCDRIYPIPGWESSRGSCIETFVAYKLRIKRLPTDVVERLDKVLCKQSVTLRDAERKVES